MNDRVLALNSFVKRQTPESEFPHFEGTWEELLELIYTWFKKGPVRPGYRDGVYLVSLPPEKFRTGVVTLEEGDILVGSFKPRQEGETPRKTLRVKRPNNEKQMATSVDAVLYSRATLRETNEDETGAEWEVISINGHPTINPAPINPEVLMHNHFQSDGGTATNMSPEKFENALRISFEYWKNKATLDTVQKR
jgi:hypothetical protein